MNDCPCAMLNIRKESAAGAERSEGESRREKERNDTTRGGHPLHPHAAAERKREPSLEAGKSYSSRARILRDIL